jgi:hypothetical protein
LNKLLDLFQSTLSLQPSEFSQYGDNQELFDKCIRFLTSLQEKFVSAHGGLLNASKLIEDGFMLPSRDKLNKPIKFKTDICIDIETTPDYIIIRSG